MLWLGMALILTAGIANGATEIPAQADWIEEGVVINATGVIGTWDAGLAGFSPCAVIKKSGTYFLYYIGADGYRSTDNGPRHRALGVATSPNGRTFTKYGGNPVITYLPHNNQEEGIFSCAATLDDNGDVVLYYGALRAANSTTESVDIDIRMRVSSNGLDFTNDTLIRTQSGQEIEPVGAFRANGLWYVYYVNNAGWDLFLLSGNAKAPLSNSQGVLSSGGDVNSGGVTIPISTNTAAVFLRRSTNPPIEVRTISTSLPALLSAPVETYSFFDDHFTVFLDHDTDTWFMYYKSGIDAIRLKTAPVTGDGGPDTIPPATPVGITVE